MLYDMDMISPADRYKLLVNTVTPRPIAWVVTLDGEGRRNAAPYSFFNAMSGTPPLVAIGMAADGMRKGVEEKDSLRAIKETGEFTVALVGEAQAEAMNLTATNAPVGVDELGLAGLVTAPAAKIACPLIAEAPVNFECRVWKLVETGPHSAIVIGEVLATHVADRFIGDEDGKLRIDNPAMELIGRTFGASGYVRNSAVLEMDRKNWPLNPQPD